MPDFRSFYLVIIRQFKFLIDLSTMGGAVSTGEDNDELIDNLVEAEYIKTPLIERIFRAVDRADYYVDSFKKNAYKDLAWKHGNLHLSAPCIYSEVMESLKLEQGLSFLNLGSGTGYLSTMVGLVIGPYGINHGVELHSDVVEYAGTKLKEFKLTSLALDEYEFCEPQFVVGNCLQLDTSSRQYDRVYCGASCPKEHENYMKSLIKIGGILLMPLGDQLLQITRSSLDIWDTKSILPVSFASLILPVQNSEEIVKLPDCEPLTLMEVCRLNIRQVLKRNVDIEHPKLKDRKRRNPKRKKNKKRIRRIVIPIFEESEDSGQGPEQAEENEAAEVGDEDRANIFGPQSSLHIMNHISGMLHRVVNRQRLHRRRMDRLSDDIDTVDALTSSSEDSDDDSDEMDSSFETTVSTNKTEKHSTPNKTLNTLLGEGTSNGTTESKVTTPLSEEMAMNNGKKSPSTSSNKDETPSTSFKDDSSKPNGSVRRKLSISKDKSEKAGRKDASDEDMDTSNFVEPRNDSTDRKRAVEDDDDENYEDDDDEGRKSDNLDSSSASDSKHKNSSSFSRSMRKRQPPIIWKRVAYEEEATPNSNDKEEEDVEMEEESYLMLVREKIQLLPLPYALKMYLNHERKL